MLTHVLSGTMQILHPFMPFITEEIWQHLPHEGESIVISRYPEYDEKLTFTEEEKQMEMIMGAISAIRNRRAEMNVPPSKKARTIIVTANADVFGRGTAFFEKLASASGVVIAADKTGIDANAVNIVVHGAEIFLPMSELVDREKELARLNAEKKKLEDEIKRVMGKLSNAGFIAKAPQKLVEAERAKGEKYRSMLERSLRISRQWKICDLQRGCKKSPDRKKVKKIINNKAKRVDFDFQRRKNSFLFVFSDKQTPFCYERNSPLDVPTYAFGFSKLRFDSFRPF